MFSGSASAVFFSTFLICRGRASLLICFVFFFLRRTTHNNRAHENPKRKEKILEIKDERERERGGGRILLGRRGREDYSEGKWDVGGFLVGFITKEEHKFKKLPDNTVR